MGMLDGVVLVVLVSPIEHTLSVVHPFRDGALFLPTTQSRKNNIRTVFLSIHNPFRNTSPGASRLDYAISQPKTYPRALLLGSVPSNQQGKSSVQIPFRSILPFFSLGSIVHNRSLALTTDTGTFTFTSHDKRLPVRPSATCLPVYPLFPWVESVSPVV